MCRQWLSRIIGIKYCQFRKSLEKRAQPAHGHLRPGEVHQRRQEEGSSERETRRAGSKQRGRAPPRRSRDREGSRRSPSFLLAAGETTEERASSWGWQREAGQRPHRRQVRKRGGSGVRPGPWCGRGDQVKGPKGPSFPETIRHSTIAKQVLAFLGGTERCP